MTVEPMSSSTLRVRRTARNVARFPRDAFTLAATLVVLGGALQPAVLASTATRGGIQVLRSSGAHPAELQPVRHELAAQATRADDEDDQDAGDEAPEEPQLEYIPMVPASEPQSLAV